MRRLARRTLNVLIVLSLLLCVATAATWALGWTKVLTATVRLRGITYQVTLHSRALAIDNAPQLALDQAALQRWGSLKAQLEVLEVEAQRIALGPEKDRALLNPLLAARAPLKRQFLSLPRPVWPPRKPWATRIPLPIASAAAGFCAIMAFALRFLLRTTPSAGPRCSHCFYNLTGNVSGVCPECGTAVPKSTAMIAS